MTYSATRLTLYAILSAIEGDLRDLLALHCSLEKDVTSLLGNDLFQRAFERYVKDGGDVGGVSSVTDLVDYLDYADAFQVLNANRHLLPTALAEGLKLSTSILEKLIPIRNRVAHTRPLNVEDLDIVLEASDALQLNCPNSWRNLKHTKQRILQNPGTVLDQTIPPAPQDKTTYNLPIPDFDETGFLGRVNQVEQLVKLIYGPYPVITVIGEGGLGKTALAIKVAYEILDRDDSPFDAIVWTSAKSAAITAQEIVRIENAITDSLGLLSSVAETLSGKKELQDPVAEIIEYLKGFKILLILDNLETVIDKSLLRFLEQLPVGSKVLITSRIGLGEFERRLKLDPLDSKEAVSLLRSLIRLRGIDALKSSNQAALRLLCGKMQNNPGYIKWFVAAVQAGSRPEQILDQPALFLDFCLSNVYQYLADNAKTVVKAMQSVGGIFSQAEIAVLTELDVNSLQRALHQLLSTNMIVMRSVGGGTQSETKYGLSELAKEYLRRHHPVSSLEFRSFQLKQQQISKTQLYLQAEQASNKFSIFSIATNSKGDVIVAKYLLDALKHCQSRNFKEAARLISLARDLAPTNYEVHRVEAWMHAASGDIPAAEESYGVAIELAPGSAPLRMLYGGFLTRCLYDNDRALEQYDCALKLAPNEIHIIAETARLYIYLQRYADSMALLDKIMSGGTLPPWMARKVYDIRLQIYQRQADNSTRQHDPLTAIAHLENFVSCYNEMNAELRDRHISRTLRRGYITIKRCIKQGGDIEWMSRAQVVESFLTFALKEIGHESKADSSSEIVTGVVCRIDHSKFFMFVQSYEGVEYYLNCSQIRDYDHKIDPLDVGDKVAFSIGQNLNGVCAVDCEILERVRDF